MVDPDFHISTTRLDLSYLDANNDAHCDFVVSLVNSPEMAQVNKANPRSIPDREAARAHLLPIGKKLEATGYGRYMISLRDEASDSSVPFSQRGGREYVGHVSMQLGRFPDAPTVPDVGFALLGRYYGKGYATEAALGLMKFFRETRGHEGFAGYTGPDNEASNRMFARMGFDDRGVKEVLGIVGSGQPWEVRVWTLGLGGELDEYGI
jgi:RimJ/RimL family protein N-acetyltransferase